jgi:glycosyltransferase involved in cell wall biosynthesis
MTRSDDQNPARISVCIPAYRAEAFIAVAIESVLAQSYQDWELIVLDNNSPDRTGEIARSYDDPRIRVETNARTLDLADNWNAVASLATGDYLKLLCADDVLYSNCLAEQAAVLDHNPDVSFVACRRDFVASDGEVVLEDRGLVGLIGKLEPEEVVERVVCSGINPIGWPPALLLRRQIFVDVGMFDARWLYPIDLELSLRMLRGGSFVGLRDSLASFRISPDSASSTIANQGRQHRDMLRSVAADPRWNVGRLALCRGLMLSHLEVVKKRLLFAAVNSSRRPLRRLPSLFLSPRGHRGRVGDVGSGPALPAPASALERVSQDEPTS